MNLIMNLNSEGITFTSNAKIRSRLVDLPHVVHPRMPSDISMKFG